MAAPRVFISSTCYDLVDERDSLVAHCNSFGFEVVLSERGDIFYHPDLHTHVSCVNEVSTCHLFILIIGGRFGGKYVADKTKSITNAEYSAARESGLPIFTFVKQDVLSDHNLWQKNKSKTFVKEIEYPSIENIDYSADIFSFIDQIRLAPSNNGIFGFRLIKDIHETLRKQWASMFFEYLQNRTISRQLATTNEALSSLTTASSKIEELVKTIYKNIDEAGAEEVISTLDLFSRAKEMFTTISIRLDDKEFLPATCLDDVASDLPDNWIAFLVNSDFFAIDDCRDDGSVYIKYDISNMPLTKIQGNLSKLEQFENDYYAAGYEAFKKLDKQSKFKILAEHLYHPK